MMLLNKHKIEIIKRAIIEYKVLFDFTKTDEAFFRYYNITKEMLRTEVKGLERQVLNCEKEMNDGMDQVIQRFKENNK